MPSAFVFPTNLTQQERVQPLLEQIDIERMTRFMTKFTSFRNRYYKSRYGKEAGDWLFAYVTELCKDVVANPEKNGMSVSVRQVSHAWGQSSIIVHIEAYDRNKQQQQQQPSTTTGDGVTIIGAHLDSVNLYNPYWGRSPGADDDGSGTTTTIEALTLLIQSGYVPPNPLEFHWYSAEEGGLLGSAKIASLYRNSGVL
ncbi:Zn-dependent exopeptidase, partial [Caulochytrium protostelioides]